MRNLKAALRSFAFIIAMLFSSQAGKSQGVIKRVLFLGNSYIYVNDLPQLLADVASSMGDSVIYDSNTPGGYTLHQHSVNPTSLEKIADGNWDFVVLQEQSQMPAFPIDSVMLNSYPYAFTLDSTIRADNLCAETVFYMTWGRRDGDTDNCFWWPPVCTYSGMDSLLRLRYLMFADSLDAITSPVGAVWHYIRDHYPAIQLYNADGSHPSAYGSYAAACSFYTVLFRRDPELITFDSDIPSADAANIRTAAKSIVYDSLSTWFVGAYDINAAFTSSLTGFMEYSFVNLSVNADAYSWDFGDGSTSAETNPIHTFSSPGYYNITLTASTVCNDDITVATITVSDEQSTQNQQYSNGVIFPNPATTSIHIDRLQARPKEWSIMNLTGSVILRGRFENPFSIDISDLQPGLYYLRLFDIEGTRLEYSFIKL